MNTLGIIAFVCGLLLVNAQRQYETFKWSRVVQDYRGKEMAVTEYAEADGAMRTILMSSSDKTLRITPFYRADSLHDFNLGKTGTVALKPQDAKRCFLADVKQPFEETLASLRKRSGGVLALGSDRRQLAVDQILPQGSVTGSVAIDSFCKGRQIVRLVDSVRDIYGPIVNDFWPPILWPPILCIWAPIDIYLDAEILATEVKLLRNYDGLYSPKV